jgi:hypothetical protein
MALEPILTSNSYSSTEVYIAPKGRIPVLGKARAQIDQLRVSIADAINQMKNRDAAMADASSKTLAENALLAQKTATELAQTSNVIPTTIGINSTAAERTIFDKITPLNSVGVVGRQCALFAKQTDGFDRDAEQKLAKIMVDTWSVRASTDAGSAGTVPAGLNEAEIKLVLNKVREGAKISPATPTPS